MDMLEGIRGRRARRDYLDEPVSHDLIGGLIDSAIWAPSGMNRQPWRFLVIEGRDALARCSSAAKRLMLKEATRRPELAAVRGMLEQPDFNIFYNAPVLVVVCATEPDEMAVKDCCLAAQTLMLAAHAQGLGSCWIGFAEAWLNSPEAKAWLGLAEGVKPVAPIILGRPAASVAEPGRRPADVAFVTLRGE